MALQKAICVCQDSNIMRRENELFFPLLYYYNKNGENKTKQLMSFSLRIAAAHYKRIFYKPDVDRISATT
jgi:hypothetical protein